MAKSDLIELTGVVTERLPGASFKVTINGTNNTIFAVLCGNMRRNKILILAGDLVTVSLSPYDLTRGIITWRGERSNLKNEV